MHRPLVLASLVALPLSAALALPAAAQTPCDAYSGGCPRSGPTVFPNGSGAEPVGRGSLTTDGPAFGEAGPQDDSPGEGGGAEPGVLEGGGGLSAEGGTTLPFTGGETVLYSLVGLGAIGVGAAFVLAGRGRSQDA